MPSSARSEAEINPERLFLRGFRRIENARATIPEKPASFKASSSAKGRGTRRTTAEGTLGGGRNELGTTVKSRSRRKRYCNETDSRPYSGSDGFAIIRSTTSC